MSTQASTEGAPMPGARSETIVYDDRPVRWFVAASVGWGIVALLLGAIVATQLAFAGANAGPWFTFGRLRPLHTTAAMARSMGHSSSAYSLPWVKPRGSETAAATMIACQPQKWSFESRSLAVRARRRRCVEW